MSEPAIIHLKDDRILRITSDPQRVFLDVLRRTP